MDGDQVSRVQQNIDFRTISPLAAEKWQKVESRTRKVSITWFDYTQSFHSRTTFHGGKDIYRSIVPLHEIVQGNLAAGEKPN